MRLDQNQNQGNNGLATLIIFVIILILAVLVGFSSYFVVPPGNMAGTRWMGGTVMENEPLTTGIHFKWPFMEEVDYLQTSKSLFTLKNQPVYTADNQKVEIGISVIYEIPKSAVFNLLYNTGKAGNVDINDTLMPMVKAQALATFAKYNTLNISAQRDQIANQMQKEISSALTTRFGINILSVQLTEVVYSTAFERSIEAAVKAKASAIQAENTVLQRQYEGQQKVVLAKANAEAAIAEANGASQAKLINAQAQAKSIDIVGQALQSYPSYISYATNMRWDGRNSSVVAGKDGMNLWLNAPMHTK